MLYNTSLLKHKNHVKMKTTILILCLFISQYTFSQVTYGTPKNETLPKKIKYLKRAIQVNHFPEEVHPIKHNDSFYWKHNTAILSETSNVEIIEYGAYIYYNDTWNLRRTYPIEDFDNTFGTSQNKLQQAQPYTFVNNWRVANQLFGGWAMWYFIGKTENGDLVCGYQKINTTNNLLN